MSDYSETNPPAFPRTYAQEGHNGMSLRDWFAGQVFAAAITNGSGLGRLDEEERQKLWYQLAGLAYESADAMLRARSAP